jgi:cell shape-determining protein MreC
VSTTDQVVDTLKEWLASSNPGLVTREDLARVEAKLDELLELLDEIEERLSDSSE